MLWWLGVKVLAVLLIIVGGFLVLFLPGISDTQNVDTMGFHMDVIGVLVGLVLLVIGGFLLFS